MSRAMWKGVLQWKDLRVPVKLHAGVNDRKVHFRLLHRRDQVPVIQKMVHQGSGEPVEPGQIIRGYETGEGQIVVLSAQELESIEPEKSRAIDIVQFVAPDAIAPQWYDRPYFLSPDGDAGSYLSLAQALQEAPAHGVLRWSMRKKRYLGALRGSGRHLQVITLRHSDQVVDLSGFSPPSFRALEKQERAMADELVRTLENDFDPSAYKDEYRERLLEFIRAKANGVVTPLRRVESRRTEPASLSDMLKQSLQHARKERKRA